MWFMHHSSADAARVRKATAGARTDGLQLCRRMISVVVSMAPKRQIVSMRSAVTLTQLKARRTERTSVALFQCILQNSMQNGIICAPGRKKVKGRGKVVSFEHEMCVASAHHPPLNR